MADHLPLEPSTSFVLTDADGRILASRSPQKVYYAASTIKLGVALAVGRHVRDGSLSLETNFAATRTFRGVDGEPFTLSGDHLDDQFPHDGTCLAVSQLLRVMISRSSNEATNILLRETGLETVTEVFHDLNLQVTRVERLIGDSAAEIRGLTNETSAADLVHLMRGAVTGLVGDRPPLPNPVTVEIVRALEAQTVPPIGRVLGPRVRWGSKSGEVPGYRHDVAFIGNPATSEGRYLAVCTRGFEESEADESIAAIVQALGLDSTSGSGTGDDVREDRTLD
ncbi:serine hydrolase [Kocuria sp. TGY1127_2]|uniref:serine hydrolase n=1 Tax=Kocuria sp. TGY1127_2 TaxID=2711328 RepID=UPI0015BCC90D|nr:serine hydrolase [Kocuria sp. TGY1127_2]